MKLIDKILKRKSRDQSIHNDDIIDVPVYGPHDNILPVPYEASVFFLNFENGFELMCRDFLKRTSLDKYNKGYMDSLIDETVTEALGLLDVQEVGHRNVINQLTRTRTSDINDAEIRLSQIPTERKEVESYIKVLNDIYVKGTAFDASTNLTGGLSND